MADEAVKVVTMPSVESSRRNSPRSTKCRRRPHNEFLGAFVEPTRQAPEEGQQGARRPASASCRCASARRAWAATRPPAKRIKIKASKKVAFRAAKEAQGSDLTLLAVLIVDPRPRRKAGPFVSVAHSAMLASPP